MGKYLESTFLQEKQTNKKIATTTKKKEEKLTWVQAMAYQGL